MKISLLLLCLCLAGCAHPYSTPMGQAMDSSNNPIYPELSYQEENP